MTGVCSAAIACLLAIAGPALMHHEQHSVDATEERSTLTLSPEALKSGGDGRTADQPMTLLENAESLQQPNADYNNTATPVPEPSAISLLAGPMLLGAWFFVRRHRT